MKEDLAYIDGLATSLQNEGLIADAVLASGDPGQELSSSIPVLRVRGMPRGAAPA